MKTLEEMKAERAALDKAIEQYNKADVHYITQNGAVLTIDYIPDWVDDETLLYPCKDWTREEVERIALACKLLRKTYIYAKENGMNGTNYYGFPRLSGDHLGLFETEAHDDFTQMQELSRKIERPLND
jgi:hypothetical protein